MVYVAHMPSMAALSLAAVVELETDFNDVCHPELVGTPWFLPVPQ